MDGLGFALICVLAALGTLGIRAFVVSLRDQSSEASGVAQSGPIFDRRTLEEAEARLKQAGLKDTERVALVSFRSDQGYTSTDVANLVVYLGSHDVSATYESIPVGLGMGAISQFTLFVPPHQLDKAETLIRSKLK